MLLTTRYTHNARYTHYTRYTHYANNIYPWYRPGGISHPPHKMVADLSSIFARGEALKEAGVTGSNH